MNKTAWLLAYLGLTVFAAACTLEQRQTYTPTAPTPSNSSSGGSNATGTTTNNTGTTTSGNTGGTSDSGTTTTTGGSTGGTTTPGGNTGGTTTPGGNTGGTTTPGGNTGGTTTPSGNTGGNSGSGTGSIPSLSGSWYSDRLNELLSASACGNFQLRITNQTSTTATGDFLGACGGGVAVSGSASGQLVGNVVQLTASGSASGPNLPSCAFSLAGPAHFETSDSIRIDFTGSTCAGPVHGGETLTRRTIPPPPPPPAPAPAPSPDPSPNSSPPPVADPLFGCGGIGAGEQLVACIHSHINPYDAPTAFEVTKRVAWALRGEGAGLLIKNGGENVVAWRGYNFSAGRICYPDGHLIKVISDVGPGGANGPSWQDNGYVDPGLYVPAMDPTQ